MPHEASDLPAPPLPLHWVSPPSTAGRRSADSDADSESDNELDEVAAVHAQEHAAFLFTRADNERKWSCKFGTHEGGSEAVRWAGQFSHALRYGTSVSLQRYATTPLSSHTSTSCMATPARATEAPARLPHDRAEPRLNDRMSSRSAHSARAANATSISYSKPNRPSPNPRTQEKTRHKLASSVASRMMQGHSHRKVPSMPRMQLDSPSLNPSAQPAPPPTGVTSVRAKIMARGF
jgi:hypothetical protein